MPIIIKKEILDSDMESGDNRDLTLEARIQTTLLQQEGIIFVLPICS